MRKKIYFYISHLELPQILVCFLKSKIVRKILFQLLFIFMFSFLFIADDFIYQLFNKNNKSQFLLEYYWLSLALSFLLLFIKNKIIIYIFLLFIAFIELSQLIYLAYFGAYLHPTIIPLIFKEIFEISETGFSSISKIYYAFLSVIIPFSIMFFLIKKYSNKLFTFRFAWLLLLLFLAILPFKAMKQQSLARLISNPKNPSLYNGLKIYSGYFFNILPNSLKFSDEKYNFINYNIKKNKPILDSVNVILIYGESFNYYNSGLYGYDQNTTPNLSKLAKEDKNFLYFKGISGAVSTEQSIPCFFNLQREPKNYKLQMNMDYNLFKLAKEAGFQTILISAQSSGLTNSIGRQYIDKVITLEDERKLFKTEKDEALLTLIKKENLKDKNFIVLHQRNLHSPYEKNYSHKQKEFEKFKLSYDNAMLFNDFILFNIINYFKNNSKIPFYLFITSDHNELTGQNGLFGHITLIPEGGDIPIMMYSKNTNLEIENKLKHIFLPTHHELGLLIAEIMGYKIENPNTPEDVFYINGNDTLGRYGFIKVIKDSKNKVVKYEIVNNK